MNIPKTMKAVVAYGKNDYRFEPEYPVPECKAGDVLIKVEGCGVCAGDLKCMHGADMFWGGVNQPAYVQPPVIPGHEFLGRVVQTGANVKDITVGDRVTADQILPCWECRFCKKGQYWMCQPHNIFGFQKENNGGMAEYMLLPAGSVMHKIPDDMLLSAALLIEPYACSKHCVDRAQIQCDDIVVIAGAGPLGLGMVTYARKKNPTKLIALDLIDKRLEKAKAFGADIVLNPRNTDVNAKIMELTEGYGCDVYIEATGNPDSVVQGLTMIRKLGRFVEFSVFEAPTTVDWSIVGDRKELDVLGAHLSPYCFPYVVENMTNGSLKTDGILTSTFPIEKWEDAFEHATGKHGDIKVAIVF